MWPQRRRHPERELFQLGASNRNSGRLMLTVGLVILVGPVDVIVPCWNCTEVRYSNTESQMARSRSATPSTLLALTDNGKASQPLSIVSSWLCQESYRPITKCLPCCMQCS